MKINKYSIYGSGNATPQSYLLNQITRVGNRE